MKNDSVTGSLKVTETAEGITFTVHVQPRACRSEICGVQGDELRLRLTAPPVDDAANKLCVELLAKALRVSKSRVAISAGAKSRHKTIRVEGISREEVLTLVK